MAELRKCPVGHEYWFPGERWQHKGCAVVTPVVDAMVVDEPKAPVVDARAKDRHRKTEERREYLRVKQQESRARRVAGRAS